MAGQPASPRSKLLEQIYVRGDDTVIRISDDAVIVKTNRKGGIKLPDDLEEVGSQRATDRAPPTVNDNNDLPNEQEATATGEDTGPPPQADRLITDSDLKRLSENIRDDWRTLALCYLNMSATDMESIMQEPPDGLLDKIFSMLSMWRSREGKNATVMYLTSILNQVIAKEKWEFLLYPERNQGGESDLDEPSENEGKDASLEHTHSANSITGGYDDIEELPQISLVDNGELNEVTREEGMPLQESSANNAANQLEKREVDRDDDSTLEDIERLSAVYTGFAEDKKDQFTSLGTSMGDILQKVLLLDHENKKLKNENSTLKKAKKTSATPPTQQEEQTPSQTSTGRDNAHGEDSRSGYRREEFKKQRDNYLKVKRHLTEAIEANRSWETFSRKQRDDHKLESEENSATIKRLEKKVKEAESSSSDVSRQMDSILMATENHASETQKELEKLRDDNGELRLKLRRLAEEKRKVEKLSKDLLKSGPRSKQDKPSGSEKRREETTTRHLGQSASSAHNQHTGESIQEVLHMVHTQARPPPQKEYGRHRERERSEKLVNKSSRPVFTPSENSSDVDVMFLKEQVLQYRNDFERERKDRERAAGELESLRRELEDAKMMLNLQGEEVKGRYVGCASKYTGPRREKQKPQDRFPYMGPDEVASLFNQTDGRHGSVLQDRDSVLDLDGPIYSQDYPYYRAPQYNTDR